MNGRKKLKAIEGNEDCADEKVPPIFKLNDDCMRYIFSFLHVRQRIQIQRVCKKWQRISNLPWNDVKKLDTTEKYSWQPNPWGVKFDLPIFKQVLSLCGSSIREMILPNFYMAASSDIMVLVTKMCPSLRVLDFGSVVINHKTAQIIAENFTDLTIIKINYCWNNCEDFLAQFFANNKRLKSFSIYNSDRITGTCLLELPESLNRIHISSGDNIHPEHFCSALQKLTNLRSLKISNSMKLLLKLDSFIDALPNKLSLDELDLSSDSSDRAEKLVHVNNIIQLTNLRKLVLSGNLLLHNEILANVGTHCKNLKVVHLNNCNRVTDSGWQSFTATLELEELKVQDLNLLPDKFLETMDMPSLRTLECHTCSRFRAKTFKKLVEKLENLERLDVYNCADGTWGDAPELTRMVSDALQKRKNGKTLEMHIGDPKKIREVIRMYLFTLVKNAYKRRWV